MTLEFIHMTKTLTALRLRDLLLYNNETGLFTRITPIQSRRVGDVAGHTRPDGYKTICIDGKNYLSHRLAWLYFYGIWPIDQIDHIDGNRGNNKIINLREASSSQNCENRAKRCDSTSGYIGVTLCKKSMKWQAKIGHKGKRTHLGLFSSPELAGNAYMEAKASIHKFNPEYKK